jgi:hypothetical protein
MVLKNYNSREKSVVQSLKVPNFIAHIRNFRLMLSCRCCAVQMLPAKKIAPSVVYTFFTAALPLHEALLDMAIMLLAVKFFFLLAKKIIVTLLISKFFCLFVIPLDWSIVSACLCGPGSNLKPRILIN